MQIIVWTSFPQNIFEYASERLQVQVSNEIWKSYKATFKASSWISLQGSWILIIQIIKS